MSDILNKITGGGEEPEPDKLTPEQEQILIKEWNSRPKDPPSLKELVQLIYGVEFDGRDKRSKLIKKFLVTRKINPRTTQDLSTPIQLTEEQKSYIANNIATTTVVEIAEVLFNKKLTGLDLETRAVINFARTLDNRVKYADPKLLSSSYYKTPKIESAMIQVINKYVDDPIDIKKYSDKQKRWVKAMLSYVNSYRFEQQINTYATEADRSLFESCFISYTYGKDDLNPEERDQYIILCSEVVISKNIQERIEKFQRLADDSVDTSEEGKRLSMNVVEMISGMRKEYNDCVKRQQSLMDDLKVKRSKRIQERVAENESILNLLDAWRNYEKRQLIIKYGIEKKKNTENEVARLDGLDELKFQIFGLTKNEALNS